MGAALIVLALGLVGAIAGPRIAEESALTRARAVHTASYANWLDAAEKRSQAEIGLDAARSQATVQYTQARELAEAVPAEMLTPSTQGDSLRDAVAAYAAAAGLEIDSAGALVTDAAADPPAVAHQSVPFTTAELSERTRSLDASSAELIRSAEDAWGRASAAYAAESELSFARREFVAAAYASGTAWSVPEKASAASRDAYVRAATALNPESVGDETDARALVVAYVSSRRDVQQSHDDAVAAEAAAKARQSAPRTGASTRPTVPFTFTFLDVSKIRPPSVVNSSSWVPGCGPGPVILVDQAGWAGISDVGLSVPYTYWATGDSVYYYACLQVSPEW